MDLFFLSLPSEIDVLHILQMTLHSLAGSWSTFNQAGSCCDFGFVNNLNRIEDWGYKKCQMMLSYFNYAPFPL